jgi:predicted transcriptional regulator
LSEPTQKNVFDRSCGWSEEAKKILQKDRKKKEELDRRAGLYHTSIRAREGDTAMAVLMLLSDWEPYTEKQIVYNLRLKKWYEGDDILLKKVIKNLREGNLIVNPTSKIYRITDKGYRLYELAMSSTS